MREGFRCSMAQSVIFCKQTVQNQPIPHRGPHFCSMKYIRQFSIILLFSLAGDLCHAVLPLPIPASIYGMVLLLLALMLKVVRVEAVAETGEFLVSMLPVLFVAPTVKLLDYWQLIAPSLWQIAAIVVISTVVVFAVSGWVTQALQKKEDSHG